MVCVTPYLARCLLGLLVSRAFRIVCVSPRFLLSVCPVSLLAWLCNLERLLGVTPGLGLSR